MNATNLSCQRYSPDRNCKTLDPFVFKRQFSNYGASIPNICCFKQDLDRNNVWWIESGSMDLWRLNWMYVSKVTSWPLFFCLFLRHVGRAKKRPAPEWTYLKIRESLSLSLQPRAEILHATNCYHCLWWERPKHRYQLCNHPLLSR